MTKFLEPDFTRTYYTTVEKGIVYYHHLPRWKKPLFHIANGLQWVLWRLGYSWHSSLTDLCCPDFSCCIDECTQEEQSWLHAIAEGYKNNESFIAITKR